MSAGDGVASWGVAAAGLALVVAWAVRVRAVRDAIGPRPAAPLADTSAVLVFAIPAWLLLTMVAVVGVSSAGIRAPVALQSVATSVHAAIGVALWIALRRRMPVAPASPVRQCVVGVLAGLATFGIVAVAGELLKLGYGAFGVATPEQGVVTTVRNASGAERAVVAVGAVLLAPFGEEMFWRATMLPSLAQRMSATAAVLVQGAAFGAIHFVGAAPSAWPLAIPIAIVGAACGFVYVRTGSIRAAMLAHATFNAIHVAILFAQA